MNLLMVKLVLLNLGLCSCRRPKYQVLFTNVSAWFDPNYGNGSLTLQDSHMNFIYNSMQTIDKASYSYQLNVKMLDDVRSSWSTIANETVNVCAYLNNTISDPLVLLFYKGVMANKENHFFTKCPIAPGSYYFNSYLPDPELLPIIMNFLFSGFGELFVNVPRKLSIAKFYALGRMQHRRGQKGK